MINDNLNIQEDAKSDWMEIVNKHKKRQKGLPTLNTNAGNVEHNINMFNMMQPNSSVSVDASNGNISGDSCCESYSLYESKEHETVMLEYENIPVEVAIRPGNSFGHFSRSFGNWLPDDDKTKDMLIDWTYEVDKDDIIEFLGNDGDVQADLGMDNLTDEEFDAKLSDEFDLILDKYMSKVLDYFYDDALDDAQKNYKYGEDIDYYNESVKHQSSNKELDDTFDMSMRTLL